jgi:hypothetical protein
MGGALPQGFASRVDRRIDCGVAAAFTSFFALLLAPFPLRGRLPGNCDTWLNGLALPNAVLARLGAVLRGDVPTTALYPESGIFGFGESSFGTSLLFALFRLPIHDDVTAYYCVITLTLAGNAFGVYRLARHYVADPACAAFAGLTFAASNYVLGNIDSPHTSFFLVALLCLDQCKRHLETGSRRALIAAAVLGGLQVWFSAYVFLFLSVTAGLMLAAGLFRTRRGEPRVGFAAAGIYLALALPFFAFYARTRASENFVNPWDPVFLAEVHSLEPADLLRTLDNNLVYPFDMPVTTADIDDLTRRLLAAGLIEQGAFLDPDTQVVMGRRGEPDDPKYFVYTRRCAFVGFILPALAVYGLLGAPRRRLELLTLWVASFLVALGPWVTVAGRFWPNALYPLYAWWPPAGALRVPCRAYSFAVLAVVLAAALGLERLAGRCGTRRSRYALLVAVCAAVLVENVPLPLAGFAGRGLAEPEPLVRDFFADRRGEVLLDLPSSIGGALYKDGSDLFEWNRELIYMNRQTYLRQHTVNGVHGYFPRSRLEAQRSIDRLPEPEALQELRDLGVRYLVYHRSLELPWERGLHERLERSPFLTTAASSPQVTIFGWAPASP